MHPSTSPDTAIAFAASHMTHSWRVLGGMAMSSPLVAGQGAALVGAHRDGTIICTCCGG